MNAFHSFAPVTTPGVFVDGDSVAAHRADRIRLLTEEIGRTERFGVYGNGANLAAWRGVPGWRFHDAGPGKNAGDILLALDALEAALIEGVRAFVIASADRDLGHLALRLRGQGLFVLGVGEADAPEGFRAACSRFEPFGPAPEAAPDLDVLLQAAIVEADRLGRGMGLKDLGRVLQTRHGLTCHDAGVASWRAHLAGRPDLYDLDPPGRQACVRARCQGIATVW
ncbi:NYN domain-containing protein [uncultured Jannaschia sp.]|uniref:NYN domain-containing protein n=1 Tax=uncultured Jannaschia sp. TaxID=293347 RepID=UPI0026358E75|nr:NYN domain-containing protein [uncultured Jannaschia sp.]